MFIESFFWSLQQNSIPHPVCKRSSSRTIAGMSLNSISLYLLVCKHLENVSSLLFMMSARRVRIFSFSVVHKLHLDPRPLYTLALATMLHFIDGCSTPPSFNCQINFESDVEFRFSLVLNVCACWVNRDLNVLRLSQHTSCTTHP